MLGIFPKLKNIINPTNNYGKHPLYQRAPGALLRSTCIVSILVTLGLFSGEEADLMYLQNPKHVAYAQG